MALKILKGRANYESNSSGNIGITPYLTITTAGTPRTLLSGNKNGTLKKILNTSGDDMVLNSDIAVQSSATDIITLSNNAWCEIMYVLDEDVTERYRVIDVSSVAGVVLS